MDIGTTVKSVRQEYKNYLAKNHPDWKDATLNTHVSDAFYIWNNTLTTSFWKCLVDDKSMEQAGQAIYEHLKNDLLSDNAEERAKNYYKDLCALKEFLDSQYGGVKNRVGYEFDCEKTIYKYAKLVYDQHMTKEEAVSHMVEEVPCYNETSHKMTHMTFAAMVEGKKYTRRLNTEATMYFIEQIGEDYGLDKLKNALIATLENIKFMYETSGNKSKSFCKGCTKIAQKYGFDISFDDSIFNGIIPKQSTADDVLLDKPTTKYWVYHVSENWRKMQDEGIITFGGDFLGDPMGYESKEDLQNAMIQYLHENGDEETHLNPYELWQFFNDLKTEDVVYVRDNKNIIGRGVVASDFVFDVNKTHGARNYHKIDWTHVGKWEYPGKPMPKVLADITQYTDTVNKLEALFDDESGIKVRVYSSKQYDSYTKDDFLKDVFMEEDDYDTLKNLLLRKKNIILQGAPGVGKTYAAKRLAYSIMGEKDNSRVKVIQFHQSYSYEDFIMGFRPTEKGYKLHEGSFYKFCKQAVEDSRDHFFIIDEINRGNLSKIFGELFMLIEHDKRGVELELLYREERFAVPKNVYIIGMMNTADRSLAMLDYALRRRFAFFDMQPAFNKNGFKAYQKEKNNDKFNNLIQVVTQLNEHIKEDEALGEGFCIGHSYFVTEGNIDDEWLKSVVNYELIPLLKEYWFDAPAEVSKWSQSLQEVIK